MLYIILIALLLWAVSKWVFYKWTFTAVLLYYIECGIDLPDIDTVKKYSEKVVRKSLGFKE